MTGSNGGCAEIGAMGSGSFGLLVLELRWDANEHGTRAPQVRRREVCVGLG